MRPYLLLTALPLLLAGACKKTSEAPDTDAPDTEMASVAPLADGSADDLGTLTDEAAATGQLRGYPSPAAGGYPRVTRRERVGTNPDTLLVDFGPVNVAGPYGRQRRGQLVTVYAAPFGSGPVVTTPNNYFVNDNQVTGSRTATPAGAGLTSVVTNLSINLVNGGGTIVYAATRTRQQVAGAATPNLPTDDVYVFNGSATATGPRGVAYESLAQNLRLPLTCGHYVSGTLTLTRRQNATRGVRLGFGTGTCDQSATATLLASGRTFPVTLP